MCCAVLSCRYYVEDHSNQLVRTFTGNLTKMLSVMPGSFTRPMAASEGGALAGRSAAAAGASGAEAGAGDGPAARTGEWSASRLMQVRMPCWVMLY
jgi:hypothetical protein